MPLMTIIGCRMFEDEIVHLVEKDPQIDELIVIESEDIGTLIKKLDDIGRPYKIQTLEELPPRQRDQDNGKFTLAIDLMEFALDARPERLKEEVYRELDRAVEHSDEVLIFYGLCGNVLGSVEKDFEPCPCLVRILKDEDGEVVDDCICATLGGREEFLKAQKCDKEATFFMTPMHAAHWREMVVFTGLTPDPDNIEMTKMVFDYSGYKNVAKVDTGLTYEKNYDDKVDEFAKLFDFDIIEIKGNLELIEKCYEKAKMEILGQD